MMNAQSPFPSDNELPGVVGRGSDALMKQVPIGGGH